MRESDAKDLFHNRAISQCSGTQLCPVVAFTAINYVVEGGERVLLMIQVPMEHRSFFLRRKLRKLRQPLESGVQAHPWVLPTFIV